MRKYWKTFDWYRWLATVSLLFLIVSLIQGEGPAPDDLKFRLNAVSSNQVFNFGTWELNALLRKVAFGLLAPQRFLSEPDRARYVLMYLDNVQKARNMTNDIDRAYTDPEITDPDRTTQALQQNLNELRGSMKRQSLIAEAVLEEQVSLVLTEAGFGVLGQMLPPVNGTFTPLPYILIVSPRDRIETIYQRALVAGLTAAEQETLEQKVEATASDYSAYTTAIGGLAAYPAMLLESSSIDWVTDVMAHEWTHHNLIAYPLGMGYMKSTETRTINETTASLIGDWAGQEIILRFYAPLLNRTKQLPESLSKTEAAINEPRFDFRAEMHHTRVIVDQLLAEGKIKEAEWYMEAQRRYFVSQGYRIRRLNQAYFAFHGAYASTPGASGKDPIGPAVRHLWARSRTPHEFVRTISPMTTLSELEIVLNN